jgi:outer membrane translocation and assembly module TamA
MLDTMNNNRTKPSSQDPKWGEEIRLNLRNAAAAPLAQSDSAAVLSATVYHKTGFGSDMVIGRVSTAYCFYYHH